MIGRPLNWNKISISVTVILASFIFWFHLMVPHLDQSYRLLGNWGTCIAYMLYAYERVRYPGHQRDAILHCKQIAANYLAQLEATYSPATALDVYGATHSTFVQPHAPQPPVMPVQQAPRPQAQPRQPANTDARGLGAEAQFITGHFRSIKAPGLFYRVTGQSETPDHFIYNIEGYPGKSDFKKLKGHRDQLASLIYQHRGTGEKVSIIANDQPLFLKVSKKKRDPLPWATRSKGAKKHVAQLGIIFDGVNSRIASLDMFDVNQWFVAVFASSGGGKSTVIRSMIFSLLENLSPADAEFYFIDLDSDQFDKLEVLPHTRMVCKTHEEALGLLQWLVNGVASDRNLSHKKHRYLVIDELQILTTRSDYSKDFIDLLGQLAEQSRKHGFSMIMGTQDPTEDRFPTSLQKNAPAHVAGFTRDDEYLKRYFDIEGASKLRMKGDLILSTTESKDGFKGFSITAQDEQAVIDAVLAKYGRDDKVMVVTLPDEEEADQDYDEGYDDGWDVEAGDGWEDEDADVITLSLPEPALTQAEADARKIAPYLAEAMGTNGRLKHGWALTLLEVLYGEAKPNHGGYAKRLREAIETATNNTEV